MAVLENYVTLEADKPKVLQFSDHKFVDKEIRDPLTGATKVVSTLVFDVVQEDGKVVTKQFSIVAEKLASLFEPYLAEKKYLGRRFVVKKSGSGFFTTFEVSLL